MRIEREKKTIRHMIEIHCRGRHDTSGALCADCRQLMDYAMRRIDGCPYRDGKPACGRCPVHCYAPAMREQVRAVMRYAGPRMLIFHPILAVMHFADELGKAPKRDAGK